MVEFRLEIRDFVSLTQWRWVLTGTDGALVDTHKVQLDSDCWQYEAFTDLQSYLRWHTTPDTQVQGEARIVAQVGEWAGKKILGHIVEKLVAVRPATVRVIVPTEPPTARLLLYWPLELAHAGGKPMSVQGVTLVLQLGEGVGVTISPIRDRLRVLGLFSLPTGGQSANLRRERQALVKLVEKLASEGQAADVQVLQYGVTRRRLSDVLAQAEGWDIIHVTGHGAPGQLLLENEDGSPDPVTAAELANLLDLARKRIKLVTISACWSAAMTAAEQRRLLGLPESTGQAADNDRDAGHTNEVSQGYVHEAEALATQLVTRLGCAIIAMRYPVVHEFAAALTATMYDLLARQGYPLPQALGIALRETVPKAPTAACPALSAGTPALFGKQAANLQLQAPRAVGPQDSSAFQAKMGTIPPQPERFVGRTGVMAWASAALAERSGTPGILLYGMPGGGKTACALELTYTHEHSFNSIIWYKVPDDNRELASITDFVMALERALHGLRMMESLTSDELWTGLLLRLTEVFEEQRVLLVIDNIESLLTEDGRWRDARWGQIIGALCAHTGLGRLVLTSRRLPAEATMERAVGIGAALQTKAVDALSLDEAVVLAMELPNLRSLIHGTLPGVDSRAARKLAIRVLRIARGHPKLLELADGQAEDVDRLTALLDAGVQAWEHMGSLPQDFFTLEKPEARAADYLAVLDKWTKTVSAELTPSQQAFFWLLCCLEENDRFRFVIGDNWVELRAKMKPSSDSIDTDQILVALTKRGLMKLQIIGLYGEFYDIHPQVAATARNQAGKESQDVVDEHMATYWQTAAHYGMAEQEAANAMMVVRAGLSAAPYLMRQGKMTQAAALLERAFAYDRTRATAAAVLPQLQSIAAAGSEPRAADVIAQILVLIDPKIARRQFQARLGAALSRGDYEAASSLCGSLIYLLRDLGQIDEALVLADKAIEYTRQAELGPWTQLLHEVRRLQILDEIGHHEHVLGEVLRLRAYMDTLPTVSEQSEAVVTWNVRETLLGTGQLAAVASESWAEALELSRAITESQRERRASLTDFAHVAFNRYTILLELGRDDEALQLLLECKEVYEDTHDIPGLGRVLGALAHLEQRRGHGDVALTLERDAMRYSLLAGDVDGIGKSLQSQGELLRHYLRNPTDAVVLHLAAALIFVMANTNDAEMSIESAARDLRAIEGTSYIAMNIEELCDEVSRVGQLDLRRLLEEISPQADLQRNFVDIMTRAQALASRPVTAPAKHPEGWDPAIAALIAADGGDPHAANAFDATLAAYRDWDIWANLVSALQRVRAGEMGPGLLTGLDDVDSIIVNRTRKARDGTINIPHHLWPAAPVGPQLDILVTMALEGDDAADSAFNVIASFAEHDARFEAMNAVIGRIFHGERDSHLLDSLQDPFMRAVAETVLYLFESRAA